ncbi:double-CXXCG motif protein [Myxococcus stipitatus]|uniref:SitI6 family double-CXXCG motif immunity protein n=1 Tax=Myxococcus stipitatus TaxID=83455 RepID=UPI003145455A
MRYYHLQGATSAKSRWEVRVDRAWNLPGSICRTCWAEVAHISLDFPSVDLFDWPHAHEYVEARQEPWEEYARLRDQLRPLLPSGVVVGPGSGFGPMNGWVKGSPPPVALLDGWTLLATEHGLEEMSMDGLRGIHAVRTRLRSANSVPTLHEVELLPAGEFAEPGRPVPTKPPCGVCGNVVTTLAPLEWRLDAASIPEVDAFRFQHWTTCVIVSERFLDTVRGLGCEGEFEPRLVAGPAEERARTPA